MKPLTTETLHALGFKKVRSDFISPCGDYFYDPKLRALYVLDLSNRPVFVHGRNLVDLKDLRELLNKLTGRDLTYEPRRLSQRVGAG